MIDLPFVANWLASDTWMLRRRLSGNDIATHFVFGRSWTRVPFDLKKIPTDTGSITIGPSDSRCARTASKIGRSHSGPVAKYCSRERAGAHSCDCRFRRKVRPQSGQVQLITHNCDRSPPSVRLRV